ncbi:hypothetical protein [Rufibacter soli]|jgi:hypothetical protein
MRSQGGEVGARQEFEVGIEMGEDSKNKGVCNISHYAVSVLEESSDYCIDALEMWEVVVLPVTSFMVKEVHVPVQLGSLVFSLSCRAMVSTKKA